eukprot:13996323-Alexandrium_andersonii.AAC.1
MIQKALIFSAAMDFQIQNHKDELMATKPSGIPLEAHALITAFNNYNSHGEVAVQARWQLAGDERTAIENLVLHVHPDVKARSPALFSSN